jgi:small subunit ribosomal protein S6
MLGGVRGGAAGCSASGLPLGGGRLGSECRSFGHATIRATTAMTAAAFATLAQRMRVCRGRSAGSSSTSGIGRPRPRFAPSLLSWPAAVALAYDLTLLLDTGADDDARAKVLRDVEGAIAQAGGSIANNQDWGQKVLAFKVRHKPEAHYHLIQFTGPPELPATLNRSLGINDVVLRHRLIRTPGGEPSAPPAPPAAPPAPVAADTEPAEA